PEDSAHGYILEAGQVLLDLPGRDLLVVAVPLVALHADVVVDVVLVAAAAERLAQHVVALELTERLDEARRQCLEPARPQLLERDRVEVLAVRLAGVELVVDPVEARGEDSRRGEIRVARAVDRAVLDTPRPADAHH